MTTPKNRPLTYQMGPSGLRVASGTEVDIVDTTATYVASEAISLGDPVILGSAGQWVRARADTGTKAWVTGVAGAAISSAASGSAVTRGVVTGVLSGATQGAPVYVGDTGGLSLTAAATPIIVGYAVNASDLYVTASGALPTYNGQTPSGYGTVASTVTLSSSSWVDLATTTVSLQTTAHIGASASVGWNGPNNSAIGVQVVINGTTVGQTMTGTASTSGHEYNIGANGRTTTALPPGTYTVKVQGNVQASGTIYVDKGELLAWAFQSGQAAPNSWPGTSSQLIAGDGSTVAVGSGLSLSAGTLTNTGGGGGGGVSSVSASSPLASSGGTTPNISLTGTVGVANGGTGMSSLLTNGVYYASGATTFSALSGTSQLLGWGGFGVPTAVSLGPTLSLSTSGTLSAAPNPIQSFAATYTLATMSGFDVIMAGLSTVYGAVTLPASTSAGYKYGGIIIIKNAQDSTCTVTASGTDVFGDTLSQTLVLGRGQCVQLVASYSGIEKFGEWSIVSMYAPSLATTYAISTGNYSV